MAAEWLTPEYLRDFRCLGDRCEDTCCQQWDVHYDKVHYELLLAKVEQNLPLREKVSRHIITTGHTDLVPTGTALIDFGNSRYCPFLDSEKWCEIHRHLGIDVLNNTCTFFPRVFTRQAQTVEMTGALSCPEVVRRCFDRQYSHEWTTLDQQRLPRRDGIPFSRQLSAVMADRYQQGFAEIRQCMIDLIANEDYALETRQFFLANFSSRLATNYRQSGECNSQIWHAEIIRMQEISTLHMLEDFYNQYAGEEPVAMIIIQSIMHLVLQQSPHSRLGQIVSAILTDTARQATASQPLEVYANGIPPADLAGQFQTAWQRVNSHWGIELEGCLSRYVLNCLQREWFISMPDPFTYVHLLTVRVALLKFLITMNPAVQSFVQQHQHLNLSDEAREPHVSEFIAHVVAITYPFARDIDQNLVLLQVIYEALAEQQMMTIEYSLPLIKF